MTDSAFRLVRKGYETSEVDRVVAQLRGEVGRLQADLTRTHEETAASTVELTKRSQLVQDLTGRIEMLEQTLAEVRAEKDAGVPPTFENLGARVGQMLSLAQAEGDDLRAAARAEAEELLETHRKQAADELAAAQQQAVDDRSRAETEAARLIEEAKQRADSIREQAHGEATAQLEEAGAVYEAQRAQAAAAAADFEQTLAQRRDEAMQELDATLEKKNSEVELATTQLTEARAEAERVTTEAREQSEQIIREAQTQSAALLSEAKNRAEGIRQNSERELAAATARRDSITAQLANVRQMLATLGGASALPADQLGPRTAQDWATEALLDSDETPAPAPAEAGEADEPGELQEAPVAVAADPGKESQQAE